MRPGQTITKEIAHSLEINAVNEVVLDCDGKQTKVISNNMVDMPEYILNKIGEELSYSPRECGITERVRRSVLDEILDQFGDRILTSLKQLLRTDATSFSLSMCLLMIL